MRSSTDTPPPPSSSKPHTLLHRSSGRAALAELLEALRELEGYQGFMLIQQDGTLLLEDSASPRSEAERELLLIQLQRYARTLKLLSPSRSGLDRSTAPQEIAATYQGETHLIRCLDLERELYGILTLQDVWPGIDAARAHLQLHSQILRGYALRALDAPASSKLRQL